MAGPSRRQPFPYDMLFGGTGIMLGRPEKGAPLVAVRPQTLDQVAPSTFEYGAQNPLAERIQVWDDLSLGFGQHRQESANDKRYRYAVCADLSIAGLWQKGPLITTYVPGTTDSTTGYGKFFELSGTLYCLVGRYCLQRVSDTSWTVAKDFGAGNTATDVVTFYSNGSTLYAYVGLGDTTPMYRFDGATWTQHASMTARCLVMIGRDIWRSNDTNFLSFCDTDADPWIIGNWNASNSFRVGDHNFPITALVSTAFGSLVVLKQDGVFTIDDAGQDHMLYPYLRFAATATPENGKYVGTFANDIFVNYGRQEYKLQSELMLGKVHLNIHEIGPERNTHNLSPLKGRVTAFTGIGTMYGLAGYYDDDTGHSWLLKYGAWINAQQDGQSVGQQRIDAWHGSISQQFEQKITSLFVSGVGAPSGHTRTYMLFADGSLGWLLNSCTPNPSNCSQYLFTTNDGQVYLPFFHGLFVADAKTWRGFTVASLNLDGTTRWAQLSYKSDALNSNTYADIGTNYTVSPRQRIEFPSNTWGTLSDLQVVLKSTTSGQSPQITGVGLHHSVRPYLILEYQFLVLCNEHSSLVMRDTRPYRKTPDSVRNLVYTAAGAPGSITCILADESTQELSVVDYGEAVAWDERLRTPSKALSVKAMQFKLVTVYGTVDRLGAYYVDDLAPYSVDQTGLL